jgi:hypothetical protein
MSQAGRDGALLEKGNSGRAAPVKTGPCGALRAVLTGPTALPRVTVVGARRWRRRHDEAQVPACGALTVLKTT